MQTGDFPKVC